MNGHWLSDRKKKLGFILNITNVGIGKDKDVLSDFLLLVNSEWVRHELGRKRCITIYRTLPIYGDGSILLHFKEFVTNAHGSPGYVRVRK